MSIQKNGHRSVELPSSPLKVDGEYRGTTVQVRCTLYPYSSNTRSKPSTPSASKIGYSGNGDHLLATKKTRQWLTATTSIGKGNRESYCMTLPCPPLWLARMRNICTRTSHSKGDRRRTSKSNIIWLILIRYYWLFITRSRPALATTSLFITHSVVIDLFVP